MKETFDPSITIFGQTYYPIESDNFGNGMSRSTYYRYRVNGYSIFLSHFREDRSVWDIEVTKENLTLKEFFKVTDIAQPKYEGVIGIPIADLEQEVEACINNLGNNFAEILEDFLKNSPTGGFMIL